jgi:hypothetical protein
MRNWLLSTLIACTAIVMMGASVNAFQDKTSQNDDAKWIDQLKSTPLSQMEDGLPNKPFGAWLGEQAKDAEVHYMIEACDGSAHTESLQKGTFSCVTVTALRGAGSELIMRFLISDNGSQKQYSCKFVIGQEGPPPGSPMKRMTRVFHKLSEMTPLLESQ